MKTTPKALPALAIAALFAAAQAAHAQPGPPRPGEGRMQAAERKTGEIVSQPARDVGLMKTKIPPILERAAAAPYSTRGLSACKALGLQMVSANYHGQVHSWCNPYALPRILVRNWPPEVFRSNMQQFFKY